MVRRQRYRIDVHIELLIRGLLWHDGVLIKSDEWATSPLLGERVQ
jgi:hypothetical protein